MITFTMPETTVASVPAASFTFFSRAAGKLGRTHVAYPANVGDVLLALEHVSYVAMFFGLLLLIINHLS
jgi:hypothetical protein